MISGWANPTTLFFLFTVGFPGPLLFHRNCRIGLSRTIQIPGGVLIGITLSVWMMGSGWGAAFLPILNHDITLHLLRSFFVLQWIFCNYLQKDGVLAVPQTMLRFIDLLGLTGLRFISAKGYKVKSVKGNSSWGKVQRKPGTSFQELPPGGVTQDTLNSSSSELWQLMRNDVYQGSSLETLYPWLLLDAGHIITHCLSHSKHSQK